MHIPRTHRTPHTTNTRRLSASLAVVVCAAAIIGCGSSHHNDGTGPSGGPLLGYGATHTGTPSAELPGPERDRGILPAIPNDINTESPAFKSAEQACSTLAGNGGGGGGGSPESDKLELLALARCMRAHGVPNFPDPSTTPPPPSSGNVLGGNGTYLGLGTAQERQSPAYERAARACQLTIR